MIPGASNMDDDDNQVVRNSQSVSDIENPPKERIKLIAEPVVKMNKYAGITSDQSKQNLSNREADFNAEKNQESQSKRSSLKSESDYLNETSTKQEMEVLVKSQEAPLPNDSKRMDEQIVKINRCAGITSDQSKQNLPSGEADFGAEKNKESPSERSSVKSEDDYLNETSIKQEMEVFIKPQEGQLPNNSKRMDEQVVKTNRCAGITSDQSKPNLPSGEADFGGEKNEESPSERSSVSSEDDYLNETSTKQEMEVLIKTQEGQLPSNRKWRLDDTQGKQIESIEFGRYPVYETSESNILNDQSSKKRVEQAIESLKLVEDFQKKGQYVEALSCCQSTLQLLDLSQDTNLHMKFRCNIMQLYFLMENIDEAINTYYDYCVNVIKYESDIDPKVIQSIMDLYALCTKKLKGDEE